MIVDNDKEEKKFLSHVSNSSLIYLKQGEKLSLYSTIYPGGGFSYNANQCSYGYRARLLGGGDGIVTAAHCFYQVGNELSGVGRVAKRQKSGNIDAAFIQTFNGVTPSNSLSNGLGTLSSNETMTSFPVGTKLSMLGYSNGLQHGTVNNANYSFEGVTRLVKTDIYGGGGDSGGIVFSYVRGLNGYKVAGIVTGGPQGGGSGMFFSRADLINGSFSLNRY